MNPDPAGIPPDLPPDVLGRIPLFAELQKVLSWTGGPVNWDLAGQIAVAQAAAAEVSHAIDPNTAAELAEDARVSGLWIQDATGLGAADAFGPVRAMTPAQWAEHACRTYRELVDPLAAKVSAAIAQQAPGAMEAEPGGPAVDPGVMAQALERMAPLFMGVQTGGVIGSVAKDVLGGSDLPLPSDDADAIVVVTPTVDRVAADYALDRAQMRLWVVLHECAHRLVWQALSAARAGFFARFHDLVASMRIDFSGAIEKLQRLDLSDPGALGDPLGGGGLFDLVDDPASLQASARLEHLIALVEAFCDRVVEAATAQRLPAAGRIAEAAGRHRAGSDGATALKLFMGIGSSEETRRAADGFTRAVLAAAGWGRLIRMWDDEQTLPTHAECADAEGWLRRIE